MSRLQLSPDTTADMQSIAYPQTVFDKSIFHAHHLQSVNFQPIKADPFQPDWMLAILLFCFILLAWVQVFYPKRIQQIFRAPFSKRFINQLTRDGNLFSERITVALGLIYILTYSLFIFEFNKKILGFSIHGIPEISLFGIIALVNLALMAAKVTLVQFLGAIFKTRSTTGNYLLNQLIFALLSGPVLLAALVFIIYIKLILLLYISLAVIVLLLSLIHI